MGQPRPKFRPDIIKHPFEDRGGGQAHVLEDPVGNKFFRISPYEYELLDVLNGKLTLEEAVERLRLHGRHITVEHATKLLEQFSRSGLVLGTGYGTGAVQARFKKQMEDAKKQRSMLKLYFLYISVLNPDTFLTKTLWLWRFIVNRLTALFVALLAPGALYLLITNLHKVADQFLFFFNFENLLVLWIAIASVKLIHEFSHAYTAKGFGLRVPDMGIAFLLFFPCLYCNTTAAWRLADRKQRVAISLAGITSELAIAIISTYVWHFSNPGLVKSTAFFMMAISLITSILFNGNPLMKFDGYFALIDWLRMPNLQTRSFKRLRFLFFNRVLGLESAQDLGARGKERVILTVYGILAFLYRIFLYSSIVIGVYLRFDKTIGVLLGLLAFGLFCVRPVVKGATNVFKVRGQMSFRPVGLFVFALIIGSVIFLLTRPWSNNSTYPCYVESAKIRQIVIPSEAPVSEVFVRRGDRIEADRPILSLDPTELRHELRDAEMAKALVKREIEIIENSGEDLSRLSLKYIELAQANDTLETIGKDLAGLEWITPFAGYVTGLDPSLQRGGRPGKGAVVGELSADSDCEILGLVPGVDILRISPGDEVEVWLPLDRGRTFKLLIKEISPFSEQDLAQSPFSSRYGGEIATEVKNERQKDSPLETYYLCRIDFPNEGGVPLGMTGRLVVHNPPRSTLDRVVEAAQRTFRREMIF